MLQPWSQLDKKGHCPRLVQIGENVRMAMPPNELSLGTRGKRRKTTQQIFPSKDDEKDGSSKRHTLQTERSDTGPLFGSWRVTVLGGGSSCCQELREDSESIHFNHLVEQTGNQSQERLNSITPPRSHTCRVLL